MREHRLSRDREFGAQDRAGTGFGNEKRFAVGSAEGHVRGHQPLARAYSVGRLTETVEMPDRSQSRVADKQTTLGVQRQAVGPAMAARQLDEATGTITSCLPAK